MTYKEFEKLVNEVTRKIPYDYVEDSFVVDEGYIVQRHEVGGAQGGNCWGDEAEYYQNTTSRSEFLPLDPILKEVSPDISYLKYREIESLIEEDSYTNSEYYGNYTEYEVRKLDILKLYDMIFTS